MESIPTAAEKQAGGFAIFLTGLSGSGKTTLALELGNRFAALGHRVTMLDGDDLRARVSPDLGFSPSDRQANLRRAGMIAAEVVKHGGIAICSFIAPYEHNRQEIRESVREHGKFFLVHVSTPLEECERRDPKGLYVKARAGNIASFTGISDVYETPVKLELAIDTTRRSVDESADQILRGLARNGLPPSLWPAGGLRIASAGSVRLVDTHALYSDAGDRRHLSLFRSIMRVTADRRVTLEDVSRAVGIERHTIEKIVRHFSGQSFRNLQRSILLERANMFLDEGRAIKTIAFDLGFGSPQAFHRFFKRASGRTPSYLRKSA